MKQISYKHLILTAFNELEEELEKYGFEYLFGHEYMEGLFFENFHYDDRQMCFWYMDIQTYIRQAVEADLVSTQDEEDFLLDFLLKVK